MRKLDEVAVPEEGKRAAAEAILGAVRTVHYQAAEKIENAASSGRGSETEP